MTFLLIRFFCFRYLLKMSMEFNGLFFQGQKMILIIFYYRWKNALCFTTIAAKPNPKVWWVVDHSKLTRYPFLWLREVEYVCFKENKWHQHKFEFLGLKIVTLTASLVIKAKIISHIIEVCVSLAQIHSRPSQIFWKTYCFQCNNFFDHTNVMLKKFALRFRDMLNKHKQVI